MAQHWTVRLTKYMHGLDKRVNSYSSVTVRKDSTSTNEDKSFGGINVRENWLKEHLPICHVGFLTWLMKSGKVGEYHTKGYVIIDRYDEEIQNVSVAPNYSVAEVRAMPDGDYWVYFIQPARNKSEVKLKGNYSEVLDMLADHWPKFRVVNVNDTIKAVFEK